MDIIVSADNGGGVAMAEMATKARAFQDFLDAKEIKAFVSETIENDPEETTVFRSQVFLSAARAAGPQYLLHDPRADFAEVQDGGE